MKRAIYTLVLTGILVPQITACGRRQAVTEERGPLSLGNRSVDVAAILDERVHVFERNVGMVVGVATPGRPRFFADGGRIAAADGDIDADTVFEIGSLTKVFTAVLLADMVARGEVALDDPISRYLPPEVELPDEAGERITLLHLATHTAGFPHNPPNAEEDDERGIFAAYSPARLYEYLSTFRAESAPGERYGYSNVGMGLLGHLLARHAGTTYEELLRRRVLEPLGMKDTHIATAAARDARFAEPHDAAGQVIPRWDFDVLAGAGAIRSTARDLLRFAAVAAGIEDGPEPITESLRSSYAETHPIPGGTHEFSLGWIFPTETAGGEQIFWHDGGTRGSRSFLGLVCNPSRKLAVVVLSNSAFSVNDIGLHLLDESQPLRELFRIREVSLPAEDLAKFVGSYRLSDDEILETTLEADQLFVQITGDDRYPVFPYEDNAFFYKVADARLIFEFGENSSAEAVVLEVEGHRRSATRIP